MSYLHVEAIEINMRHNSYINVFIFSHAPYNGNNNEEGESNESHFWINNA